MSVGFVHFIHREVLDTFPQLIEQCHRRLIALLTQWKTLAQTNIKVSCFSFCVRQGWVFAAAKSIFAGTVEKTGKKRGKNRQKLAISLVY